MIGRLGDSHIVQRMPIDPAAIAGVRSCHFPRLTGVGSDPLVFAAHQIRYHCQELGVPDHRSTAA